MNNSFLLKNSGSVFFLIVAVLTSASFLISLGLVTATIEKINDSLLSILRIFTQNLFYDLRIALFLALLSLLHLFLLLQRFIKPWFNISMSYIRLLFSLIIPDIKINFYLLQESQ